MLGFLALILLVVPLLFQMFYGRKAIGEDISSRFSVICGISVILQITLTLTSFYIEAYSLQSNKITCGMPLVGIIMLSFLLSLFLTITILTQYWIKKSYED